MRGDGLHMNRELWDERVPIHVGGDFDDVREGAIWRTPDGMPPLPLMYSVRATLPT